MKLWEITINQWSTCIVQAETEPRAEELALADYGGGLVSDPDCPPSLETREITQEGEGVVHSWSR